MHRPILLFLSVTAAMVFAAQAHAQLVIANPNVQASSISKSELKDVFTGSATNLKDRSTVTPAILKTGTVSDQFLAAYIGKADTAFHALWRSLVFSGQATMPRQLDSDAAMVQYIAHTPGTIGYIGRNSAHEGVKVLTVK